MNPTNEMERMAQTIRRLEARLQALEQQLSGAADSMVLRCGSSAITIGKTGIVMDSKDIRIKASGSVTVTASKNVEIKGAKVLNN